MLEPWYMVQGPSLANNSGQLSLKDLVKLRRFYTQQLALSQALLEAKQPGICKTTISGKSHSVNMRIEDIPTRENSKEISL